MGRIIVSLVKVLIIIIAVIMFLCAIISACNYMFIVAFWQLILFICAVQGYHWLKNK